jgi:hypothetical protein
MGIIDITGNKKNAWALLISQEIEKKCMISIMPMYPLFPLI